MKKYRRRLDKKLARRKALADNIKTERQSLETTRQQIKHWTEAQSILQQVAQTIQQNVHTQIANVVSHCLRTIFEEPYQFKIHFEQKRGRTEARMVFERDGVEIDPLRASGGGVVDVAAFALRLACLVLSRPRKRLLVVLDEPFKFLSADNRPRVKQLLESLAEDMGVQFIMVTHIDELRTGTIVEIKK